MGLVQYDSSDEDEEVQTRVEAQGPSNPAVKPSSSTTQNAAEPTATASSVPTDPPSNTTLPPRPNPAPGPQLGPVLGPTLGPSRPPQPPPDSHPSSSSLRDVDLSFLDSPTQQQQQQDEEEENETPHQPPRSPYTTTRTLLRDLTLPAHPDMTIPPSPPGTPPPGLGALTAKFDTFLRLKRTKGIHFNNRLASAAGMKNPAVADKLLAFVGVEMEFFPPSSSSTGAAAGGEDMEDGDGSGSGTATAVEQYGTVLSSEVWDPTCFPTWAYRGPLRKAQERGAKERERGRGEAVEFVAATSAAGTGSGSAGESRSGTPGVGKRKGRFDT
ncbi:hypothetical protein C8A00DRAFT_43551 [Chaetomidium leptoderma]|uniref:HCNGP-like protein n=1 Tax=Chaetomidium leptoderma TaxID=669021 RepID=A0AAN6ZX46_9PEZI|nr:hypothetical protein C8A00DRAFT_43551 [Chaetomidium leptoderma]